MGLRAEDYEHRRPHNDRPQTATDEMVCSYSDFLCVKVFSLVDFRLWNGLRKGCANDGTQTFIDSLCTLPDVLRLFSILFGSYIRNLIVAFSSFDSCVVTKVEPSDVHAYNKLRKDTIDMSSCSVVESIAIAFSPKPQVEPEVGGQADKSTRNKAGQTRIEYM